MTMLSRRDVLAIGAWTFLARPPRHLRPRQDDLMVWLREHVDAPAVASLAAAYRQKYPGETPEQLRAQVLSGKKGGENLAVLLTRKVREDFAEERMVTLEGWVLSRTEGRLIALTI